MDWLSFIANVASILTAVAGVAAAFAYRLFLTYQRKLVEDYLWDIIINPRTKDDPGDRSLEQLVVELNMSLHDVERAIAASTSLIRRLEGPAGPLTMRLRVSHGERYGGASANVGRRLNA